MSKFVIGDRLKDEWISVLDTEKKKLEFTNHLASAKEFNAEDVAKSQLKELQTTGYFTDLGIYLLQDGKAYIAGERDNYHPIDSNTSPGQTTPAYLQDVHMK